MTKRQKATRKRKDAKRIHGKNAILTVTLERSEYAQKLSADIAFLQTKVAVLLKDRRRGPHFVMTLGGLTDEQLASFKKAWAEQVGVVKYTPILRTEDLQGPEDGAIRLKELNAQIRTLKKEHAAVSDPHTHTSTIAACPVSDLNVVDNPPVDQVHKG